MTEVTPEVRAALGRMHAAIEALQDPDLADVRLVLDWFGSQPWLLEAE